MAQKKSILGALAVENQLISQSRLEEALENLKENCSDAALRDYLEEKQLVSEENLDRLVKAAKILAVRQKEFSFGAIVVRLGFINQNIVNLALQQQRDAIKERKKPQRIGDMLVHAGFLTSQQRNYVLGLQKRRRIETSQSVPSLKENGVEKSAEICPESEVESSGPTPIPDPLANEDLDNFIEIRLEDIDPQLDYDEPAMGMAPQYAAASESIAPAENSEEFQILSTPITILPGLRLQVAEDGMAAYLTKFSGFDRDMPVKDLKDALKKESIVFGVLPDEMLEGFIDSSGFRVKPFKVAKGIAPKGASQVEVKYFFPTDIFKSSELDMEGKIIDRKTSKTVQVPKGAILAEKIVSQAKESTAGSDIYGNVLTTDQTGQELFRPGTGTQLSSDGLKILARRNGRPRRLLSGEIKVVQTHVHEGDVGEKTGHMSYDADLHIKGEIQPGFRVVGHNIRVVSAQKARINAQENLIVSDGIIETIVHAQGDVFAGFIRNSKIRCMGNVIVAGDVIDSVIICSGACSLQKGALISSDVSAKKGVFVSALNTDSQKSCHIQVGRDGFVHGELKFLKKGLIQIRKELDSQGKKKQKLLDQMQHLQDEVTKLVREQGVFQVELKDHETQLAALKKAGKEDKIPEIEYQISRLQKSIAYIEKKLEQAFQTNENMEEQAVALDEILKEHKEKLQHLWNHRKQLIQWSVENPGKPIVKVIHTDSKS